MVKKSKRILSLLLSLALVLSLVCVPTFAAAEDVVIPDYIQTETVDGVEYLLFDSGEDMEWLRTHVMNCEDGVDDEGKNYCTHNIKLVNDIDMTGHNGLDSQNGTLSGPEYNNGQYSGIGWGQAWIGYSGIFDGQGHTIYNLDVYTAENNTVGPKGLLFNITKNATIKNIVVQGTITSNRYTGGLVGRTTGSITLENVVVEANLLLRKGQANAVGGLIGQVGSGQTTGGDRISVTNCAAFGNYVSQTPDNPVGGLVGHIYGGFDVAIENSFAAATLSCEGGVTAGLIASQGTDSLVINNCYFLDTMAPTSLVVMTGSTGDANPVGPDSIYVDATPVAKAFMQTDEFLNLLGGGFVSSANGYPVPATILDPDAVAGVTVDGKGTKYDTLAEAITAAGTNEATVTLLADVAASATVPAGANMVLDLNGKTLTGTVTNSGTLTIQDSAGGGAVNGGNTNAAYNNSGATMTINGGTFTSTGSHAVQNNQGTLTINDGTVTSTAAGNNYAVYSLSANSNLTVNGGTFTSAGSYAVCLQGGNNVRATITDGTFTAAETAAYAINSNNTNGATVTISGGTYNKATVCNLASYLVEGYEVLDNENGTWSVVSSSSIGAVAQIGETPYRTLAGAIEAAGTEPTEITLVADTAENVTIPAGADIALDLNGKTLSGKNTAAATVTNNGVLTIRDSAGAGTITAEGDGYPVYNDAGASLLITGGNIIAQTSAAVYNNKGTSEPYSSVLITGGTFSTASSTASVIYTNEYGQVKISGGTFSRGGNTLTSDTICTGGAAYYLVNGYDVLDNGDGSLTVVKWVAQVGTTKYTTVSAAVAAAKNGGTVTLLCDVAEDVAIPAGANVTLDLNGQTLTGTVTNNNTTTATSLVIQDGVGGGAITSDTAYAVYNNGSGAQLTINSGTVSSGSTYAVYNTGSGTLTVNGGAITSDTGSAVCHYGGATVTTITGGTFTAGAEPVIATTNSQAGKVQISGGTYSSNNICDGTDYLALGYVIEAVAGSNTYIVKLSDDLAAEIVDSQGNVSAVYTSLADAVTNAAAGDTVVLLADVAASVTVPAGANLVLDLNGKTLTGTVTNSGTLTIQDSVGGGAVNGGNTNAAYNNGGATMIINGGAFTSAGASAVQNLQGTLTINDGTVTSTAAGNNYAVYSLSANSNLTINGGAFTSTGSYAVCLQGGNNVRATITDGTFTAAETAAYAINSNNLTGATVTISGGTYNKETVCNLASYLADGYEIIDNENGTWSVENTKVYLVSVTSGETVTKYETLAEAVTNAGAGDTVTLLADVTEENVTVPAGADIILDLNGKTLSNGEPSNFWDGYTLGNKGTLIITDNSEEGDGEIQYVGAACAVRNDGGDLTIAGGTVTAPESSSEAVRNVNGKLTISGGEIYADAYDAVLTEGDDGELAITGGTITCTYPGGDAAVFIGAGTAIISGGTIISNECCSVVWNSADLTITGGTLIANECEWHMGVVVSWAYSTTSVTVSGGTFKNLSGVDEAAVYVGTGTVSISGGTYSQENICNVADYLAAGCEVTPDETLSGYYTVAAAKTYVASVISGETVTKYETVTDAINNAGAGDTVTLLADVAETVTVPAGADIVLDLNGKTLTGMLTNSGTLVIQDYSEEGTGTIYYYASNKFAVSNRGTMTVAGGTIEGYHGVQNGMSATLITTGGHISASKYGVECTISGTLVELKGGTITASSATDGSGLYIDGYNRTTVIIDGAVINSAYIGVTNNTSLTVESGTITSTGGVGVKNGNGISGSMIINGGTITGATYAVNNTSGSSGTLTITGGVFTAPADSTGVIHQTSGTVTISGGTYSQENVCDAASYLADGYAVVPDETRDGYYTVAAVTIVASVTSGETVTEYTTLAAAINNAGAGDTVTLLDNVTENVTVPANADIVLELNGKTLTGTVTNQGTLVIQDSVGAGTIDANKPYLTDYTVYNDGGDLTVKSGAITGALGGVGSVGENASVTVSGGSIKGSYYGVVSETAGARLTISDGTISGSTYAVKNGGTLTVTGGTIFASSTSGVYNEETGTAVISGGTLTATFTNGSYGVYNAGGQVTISGDAVLTGVTYGARNDNNGTMTVEGGTLNGNTGAYNNSGTMNIQGGTINALATSTTAAAVRNSGTLTISGGNLNGTTYGVYMPVNTTAQLAVTGGTFTVSAGSAYVIYALSGAAQVSGGIYSQEAICNLEDYLAASYQVVADQEHEGYYTVSLIPYELYFEIQPADRADSNGNGSPDVLPGETFTAALYIKSNIADTTVQAFDIYVQHDGNLIRNSITDGVFSVVSNSTDTLAHIQSVANAQGYVELTAGVPAKLATFTFTVGDEAEKGDVLSIGFAEDQGSQMTHISIKGNGTEIFPAKTGASVDVVYETYTITWLVDGEDPVTSTVEAGETPVYPGTLPTKEGYVLVWDQEPVAAAEDVTYTGRWVVPATIVFQDYTYAKTGDVLMIVSADALTGDQCYTYNGESLFYTEDDNYTKVIGEDVTGVYLYIISEDEMETAAGSIGIAEGVNEVISRNGDVNGVNGTLLGDANVVYQLLLASGDEYLDDASIGIRARLEADMFTEWTEGDGYRGTIDDVFAIVNKVNS